MQIFSLSHGGLIPGLVMQQLLLPNNGDLVQFLVACWIANLAILKPNFEIAFFWRTWLFFLNQKYQSKSGFFFIFFQSAKLGSGKTLSELHIHYKSLLTGVYDHAGCKEYCRDFTVALKIFDIKNNCTTVYLRWKKMLLKIGIAFYRCFWRALIPIFLFGYACLCVANMS